MGAALVAFFCLAALFAPWISPYPAHGVDVSAMLLPPSAKHWLGTDALGRDVLSRLIEGSRVSLIVGVGASLVSVGIGVFLGALAGYFRGWVDAFLMRVVDVMLSLPTLFLVLAVVAFLNQGIVPMTLVIGATSWMGVSRLTRAEFLSLSERAFVLAAKGLGASWARIAFVHMLPHAFAPVAVAGTLGVAQNILLESALSFLGLGMPPPTASWGSVLREGFDNIQFAWWLNLFPGVAILLCVLGYHLLGEGLRQSLWQRNA